MSLREIPVLPGKREAGAGEAAEGRIDVLVAQQPVAAPKQIERNLARLVGYRFHLARRIAQYRL